KTTLARFVPVLRAKLPAHRTRSGASPATCAGVPGQARDAQSPRAAFTSPRNPAQSLHNPTSPQDIHKENQCFIPKNLAGSGQIPLRDSPRPGQPFLTAPDRETPDGRNGLRAAAGGKAGCKSGSEPRKCTDERRCEGSHDLSIGGETVEAAAEGLRAAVATGGRKALWMRDARQRAGPIRKASGGSQDPCKDRIRAPGAFSDSAPPQKKRDPPAMGVPFPSGLLSASVAPVPDP